MLRQLCHQAGTHSCYLTSTSEQNVSSKGFKVCLLSNTLLSMWGKNTFLCRGVAEKIKK